MLEKLYLEMKTLAAEQIFDYMCNYFSLYDNRFAFLEPLQFLFKKFQKDFAEL